MNLVIKGNGLSWHSDVLSKHLLNPNVGVLEMFSKQESEMFSNTENKEWKCFQC